MNLFKYSLMIIIGAISYGTLSTIIKIGFHAGFTSGELVGGQYLLGWILISLLFLFSFRYSISGKNAFLLLLTGMLTTLVGKTYSLSIEELPASIAVVFLFQFTWIGVFLESLVTRKLPSRNKLLAVILLFAGTLFAGSFFGQPLAGLSLKGIGFGLLAALFFSLYIFCNSRVATHEPTAKRLFYIGTGAMLTAVCTTNPIQLVTRLATTELWQYGLLLAVLGVIIPFFMFAVAFPKVGLGLGGILCAAELPSATVISILLLHETVSPLQWLGLSLIVIGIILPELLTIVKLKYFRLSKEIV
ncbi:EamA family transporter [Bacillus massiliglaciei]|uniref:EamA family transporter n=1 Tax=Bacillus massiliglaciei TaxID=1816693 RepID=UPI000A668983